METLTKEQRHEVYKTGLERILNYEKEYRAFFFCTDMIKGENINVQDFPELFSKKPKINLTRNCWFDMADYRSRIEILTQCIEETR